jgi:hypothetical protein
MEAFSAVLDKVKSNPEVVDKVKEEVMNLGEKFHLTKHGESFYPGLFIGLGQFFTYNYLVALVNLFV